MSNIVNKTFKVGDRIKINNYCVQYPKATVIKIDQHFIEVEFDTPIMLRGLSVDKDFEIIPGELNHETKTVNFLLKDAENWELI